MSSRWSPSPRRGPRVTAEPSGSFPESKTEHMLARARVRPREASCTPGAEPRGDEERRCSSDLRSSSSLASHRASSRAAASAGPGSARLSLGDPDFPHCVSLELI
ncbi:hypothetical protein EYF80_064443 [Liparis tanakae]|uniref:Uncharacterized protein n=1 Tax=Liparis tanakae TaxID=230148 RepID=A0A4Z2E9D4_9TELE|nr:hypothetical protein EYF80_064443 [Liparis tanakae]